jgi:hypothetical protein
MEIRHEVVLGCLHNGDLLIFEEAKGAINK